MKKLSVLFLFILIFTFIFASCKTEPEVSDSVKTVVERDENGHLTQIDYYKNDSIYKTEYYEYLNKHDDESRLVKTVENDQVTYEMEECWKIAYRLQNNTFKISGELGYISKTTQKFQEINENDKTIYMIQSNDTSGCLYDIESITYWFVLDKDISFYLLPISNISYQIISTSSPGDGNANIFVLVDE